MVPELLLLSSNRLIRFGRHEFVQLRILREAVFKGDDVSGAADQAAARRHIGDVPQLVSEMFKSPASSSRSVAD